MLTAASLNIEELERALEETRALLRRERAENARLRRVNVELDRRLQEAACENVKTRARLVEIYKRERATRGEYERGYADGAASALVEATREMEW